MGRTPIHIARAKAEKRDPRLPYHTGAYDDTWEVVAVCRKGAR
ncbi:hypothetical protein M2336_001655 [Sphingobium sp. B1D7B]|nr:hypothetical protein [Sphingobium sp. B1D7B]